MNLQRLDMDLDQALTKLVYRVGGADDVRCVDASDRGIKDKLSHSASGNYNNSHSLLGDAVNYMYEWQFLLATDCYQVPPLDCRSEESLKEVVSLLDERADMSLVRDTFAENLVREALNTLLTQPDTTNISGGSDAGSRRRITTSKCHSSRDAGGGSASTFSTTWGSSGETSNDDRRHSDRYRRFCHTVPIDPIFLSIYLCDAIYDIEYNEQFLRHTRLCRHLFHVMLHSNCDQQILFAYAVFQRILRYIQVTEAGYQQKHEETINNNISRTRGPGMLPPISEALVGGTSAGKTTEPFWEFISKEIADLSATLLRQIQSGGSRPGSSGNPPAQAIGLMWIVTATLPCLPPYTVTLQTNSFIQTLVTLSSILSGFDNPHLAFAAYRCLETSLRTTHNRKPADIIRESNILFEGNLSLLKESDPNILEGAVLAAMNTIKAVLAVRGGGDLPRSQLNSLCNIMLDHYKTTKKQKMRRSITSLFSILACADPQLSSRKMIYVNAVLEPLKHFRDMTSKPGELQSLRVLLRTIGYNSLDSSTKVCIESILVNLLSKSTVPNSTLGIPVQDIDNNALSSPDNSGGNSNNYNSVVFQLVLSSSCWSVIGAICATGVTSAFNTMVAQKCIPMLNNSVLGCGLLEALKQVRESRAPFVPTLEAALERRAEQVLRRTSVIIESSLKSDPANLTSPVQLSRRISDAGSVTKNQSSAKAFLVGMFMGKDRGTNQQRNAEKEESQEVMKKETSKGQSISHIEAALVTMGHPSHEDEITCALKIFCTKPAIPAPLLKQIQEALKLVRQHGAHHVPIPNAAQIYWDQIKEVMLPLMAHPKAAVRLICGRTIGKVIRRTLSEAFAAAQSQQNSAAPPPVTVYHRACLIPFLDDFSRCILLETEPRIRASVLRSLSDGPVGSTATLQDVRHRVPSEIVCEEVMVRLVGLLQGSKRVRRAAFEVMLCVGSAVCPSARAQDILTSCVTMHTHSITNITDPEQVARSCSILALLFKEKPTLLTTYLLSTLLRALCKKLQGAYIHGRSSQYQQRMRNDGDGTKSGNYQSGAIGQPYFPKFDPSYYFSENNGEDRDKRNGPCESPSYCHPIADSTELVEFDVSVLKRESDMKYRPNSGELYSAGRRGNSSILSTNQALDHFSREASQTILLLDLLNRLLMAAKTLQRNRLLFADGQDAGKAQNTSDSMQTIQVIIETIEAETPLETLWHCLLESSRCITALTMSSSILVKRAKQSNRKGVAGTGEKQNKYGDPADNVTGIYNSQPPISPTHNNKRQVNNISVNQKNNSADVFLQNRSIAATMMHNRKMSTMVMQTVSANAISVQHLALCALTDLLTLSPQNIIVFAHKTALIDYLRTEYLRCCGASGGRGNPDEKSNHRTSNENSCVHHGLAIAGPGGSVDQSDENSLSQLFSIDENNNFDVGSPMGPNLHRRHRLSIIRLFGLLGAIDPAHGGFVSHSTADSFTIVVEGDTSANAYGRRKAEPNLARDAAMRNAITMGNKILSNTKGLGMNPGNNLYGDPYVVGGILDGMREDGMMVSAKSSAIVLKNTSDPKKNVYPFTRDNNYPIIVYRMLVKLFLDPKGVSDTALKSAFKVSIRILRNSAEADIQGWNLLESILGLLQMLANEVSDEIRFTALSSLPELIRLRRSTALTLTREVFEMVLYCWNPRCDRTLMYLLSIVEELHRIPTFPEGAGDVKASADKKVSSPVVEVGTLKDSASVGTSLYLKLVDVALQDNSPSHRMTQKIVHILSHIGEKHAMIAPLVAQSFIEHIIDRKDFPVNLRFETIKMVAGMVCRFSLDACVGPLISVIHDMCGGPGISLMGASVLNTVLNNIRRKFVTAGSALHFIMADIEDAAWNVKSNQTCNTDGGATILGDGFTRDSQDTDKIGSSIPTTNGATDVSSDPFSSTNLDVLVLHISKATNEATVGSSRTGDIDTDFDWDLWFYDFQRHVLLHSPHSTFRVCFDLFNQHIPLRKTLFYPAFHCLLVHVLGGSIDPSAILSPNSQSQQLLSGAEINVASRMQAVRHALQKPLRKALSCLLRYGDSESVDMCLGLHDYLEHFRSPNSSDTTQSAAVGQLFVAACSLLPDGEEKNYDLLSETRGLSLPVDQDKPRKKKALRASSLPNTNMAERIASDVNLSEKCKVRLLGGVGSDKDAEGDEGKGQKSNARLVSPWSLFKMTDLARAALLHRLHFKAVRYLENQFRDAFGPPSVATSHQARINVGKYAGLVNSLARQYSKLGMQHSVAGVLKSVKVGVDATGYELLQWWPEAKVAYELRLKEYETLSTKWKQNHSENSVGSHTNNKSNHHFKRSNSTSSFIVHPGFQDCQESQTSAKNLSLYPINSTEELTTLVNRYNNVNASGSTTLSTSTTPTTEEARGSGSSNFHTSTMIVSPFEQTYSDLRSPLTGITHSSPPLLDLCDVEGYLRTLCYCGQWWDGLVFARKHRGSLLTLSARGCGNPHYHHNHRVQHRDIFSLDSNAEAKQAHNSYENASVNKPIIDGNLSTPDNAPIFAAICAVVLQQWDDVKWFADTMSERTNRLLFTQLYLAHQENTPQQANRANYSASEIKKSMSSSSRGSDSMINDLSPFQISLKGKDQDSSKTVLQDLERNLSKALVAIDDGLKRTLPLSYSHAYDVIAKLQHFQEIEEARLFRRRDSSALLQETIKKMWYQRFCSMKTDAMSMLISVAIYTLATSPRDVQDILYHFSKSVRATHPKLGTWAMSSLQGNALQISSDLSPMVSFTNPLMHSQLDIALGKGGKKDHIDNVNKYTTNALGTRIPLCSPVVLVDYCEYLWGTGERIKAINSLQEFLDSPLSCSFETLSSPEQIMNQSGLQHVGKAQLLLAAWKQENLSDQFWKHAHRGEILRHLNEAVRAVPQEYSTWHSWALMNYRVQQRDFRLSKEERNVHIERAHRGFVAAICRSDRPKVVVQDIMRLLQLWVIYGGVDVLGESVMDAIHRIAASIWTPCIPQVVAHLGNKSNLVWAVVRGIIEKTCCSYPQLCVFHLLVPILSDPAGVGIRLRPSRAQMLLNISCIDKIQTEARAVAEGLIELAMFPVENIRDLIGQALKILRANTPPIPPQDKEVLLKTLKAAHDVAVKEKDELVHVGDIGGVLQVLIDYSQVDRQYWDAVNYCTQLYGELQEHVKEMKKIELHRTKCALSTMSTQVVWVPGEYNPSTTQAPTIASFANKVDIIESKRRPRRLHAVGSDGNIYTYCLKGNEDVRTDARAMQLFGLVNSLGSGQQPIARFPVIPLSEIVGLLGWVDNSETLYGLIRTFRSRANLPQEAELAIIDKDFGPVNDGKFQRLCPLQKAELFNFMFQQIESKDIGQVLWYRSVNAELWLKRRSRYTSSLANMSMAGYILGLGDRHPGNLLIQVSTGTVVHIDFGDCFDVARYRNVYPETVPFRLTPMLINGMEVFGVSGVFQSVCEASMQSMRTNRDSVVAMLSAFVYDPVMDKRISQQNRGDVQGVIEGVRRKLRGVEMPMGHKNLHKSIDIVWSTPRMTGFANNKKSSDKKNNNNNTNMKDNQQNTPRGGKQHHAHPGTCIEEDNIYMEQEEEEGRGVGVENEEGKYPNRERTYAHHVRENDKCEDDPPLASRADLPFVISQFESEKCMRKAGVMKEPLSVKTQVEILIKEATSIENLSQLFPGWTPWW